MDEPTKGDRKTMAPRKGDLYFDVKATEGRVKVLIVKEKILPHHRAAMDDICKYALARLFPDLEPAAAVEDGGTNG